MAFKLSVLKILPFKFLKTAELGQNVTLQLAGIKRIARTPLGGEGRGDRTAHEIVKEEKSWLLPAYFAHPSPSVPLPVAIVRVTFHVARSISATWLLAVHDT